MRWSKARVSFGIAFAGLFCLAQGEYTDQNRVDNFAALLGTGNYCKLTWQVRNSTAKQGYAIRYMDSKDGKIYTLATAGSGQDVVRATFSWDGRKVLYNVSTFVPNCPICYLTSSVYMVDVTGNLSNPASTVVMNNFAMTACWADPQTGVQCVLGQVPATRQMSLVEIGNTSNKKAINEPVPGADLGPSRWTGLSTDRKWLVGDFYAVANLYICQLNWSATPATIVGSPLSMDPNGCWSTIARDATGDNLHQIEMGNDPLEGSWDAHQAWAIMGPNGKIVRYVNCLKKASDFAVLLSGAQTYMNTRWSNNRDYVAAARANGETAVTGVTSPFVYRISNRHWTSVYQANTEVCTDMDMFWYTTTSVAPANVARPAQRSAQSDLRSYDLLGRPVSRAAVRPSGLLVTARSTTGNAFVKLDVSEPR